MTHPHVRRGPMLGRFVGLEPLESRVLLSVTAGTNFGGMNFNDSYVGAVPPDTHAAVGPTNVVETVNTAMRVFDKTGKTLFTQNLPAFFNLPANEFITDPRVVYDEQTGHFILEALEIDDATQSSYVLLAVSNTSSATGAWEKHRINITETEGGQRLWGDYPGLGWDADGIYITVNMFDFSTAGAFHHSSLITIRKSYAEDGNAATFQSWHVKLGANDFTVQPATMHGTATGWPLYMVQELGDGQNLEVLKVTANKLSSTPTIKRFNVTVPDYLPGPLTPAPQLGGLPMDTGDSRILNASWRGSTLVLAQDIGDAVTGVTHARWYQISTATGTPVYKQSGDIDPGPGISTYYPSVDINASGSIGMTYMQSSPSQYVSTYITGRASTDPPGYMDTPVLAKGGETPYYSFPAVGNTPINRAGDYSGISVDPITGAFWAANEYATSRITYNGFNANWGTWISKFTVGAGGPYMPVSPTSGGIVIGGGSSTTPLVHTGDLEEEMEGRASEMFPDRYDLLDKIGRGRDHYWDHH